MTCMASLWPNWSPTAKVGLWSLSLPLKTLCIQGTGALFHGKLSTDLPSNRSALHSGYCAIRAQPKEVSSADDIKEVNLWCTFAGHVVWKGQVWCVWIRCISIACSEWWEEVHCQCGSTRFCQEGWCLAMLLLPQRRTRMGGYHSEYSFTLAYSY